MGGEVTQSPSPDYEAAHLRRALAEIHNPSQAANPHVFGRYRILDSIGEGGMGVVYRAEQQHPARVVALKVIKVGRLSPGLLRRFEHEVEILGRLQHPGIAQIFDAGTAQTEHGPQPFFAMELIDGKPIDEYLFDGKPGLRDRLELMLRVCDAVHHAHQRGVIHRDLKPANILVTSDGQPKVLDFGVARATDSDVTVTQSMATESGQIIGTLQYMSPEQASGDVRQLDIRSDVYALGVIAYEMLAERLPYDLTSKSLPEAVRVIRDEEPKRLSSVDRNLRGDLDTIVGKALQKEKERRYSSVAELAADVRRYLNYEPISARRPGTWYQLTRFTRRNKVLVGGVAATFIALIAGTIVSTMLAISQARHRAQAELRRQEAEAVTQFLVQDVFGRATPVYLPNKTVRDEIVRVMINPAVESIKSRFSDWPLTDASIRMAMSSCVLALGRSDLAVEHGRAALEQRRRELGPDDPGTLMAIAYLAQALHVDGKLAEAESLKREALEARRRVLGNGHIDTANSAGELGLTLQALGKLAEAESCFRFALEQFRKQAGENDEGTLNAVGNLGSCLRAQGKMAEAEPLYREALDKRRAVLGDEHPNTLLAVGNLGSLLRAQGKLTEAEPYYREALDKRRRILGDEHSETLMALINMGMLLRGQGKLGEAESLMREAVDKTRQALGEEHPLAITAIANLGGTLRLRGKPVEAEPLVREGVEKRRRLLGDEHRDTIASIGTMAAVLESLGRSREAEPFARDALRLNRKALGDQHADTLNAMHVLAGVLVRQEKVTEAEPLLAELHSRARSAALPPDMRAKYLSVWGPCLVRLGRFAEAEQPLFEALEQLKSGRADSPKSEHNVLMALVKLYDETNRPEEAAKWRAKLAALEQSTRPTTSTTGS